MKNLFLYISVMAVHLMAAQECIDINAIDTQGNTDVLVDCDYAIDDNVCFDLQVEYSAVPSTEDYEVSPIAFEPIIPFDQGTPLTPQLPNDNGIVDDIFSDVIPLGFTFCFYDQRFTDIVIGANGLVTFDLSEANSDIPAAITSSNPNPALIENAIFGVQQDLVFDANTDSEIYYSTIGEAPCRKFVINYYNAQKFGCPGDLSTTQIVLHEFTNEIEVHVYEKPIHCPNGRDANSLLGIMNQDGTMGISPPDRNTGDWSAYDESWLFSPIGSRAPVITWTDDLGNVVGSGDQINVCPNRNTTYTVQVQYQSCLENDIFGTDTITITYADEFPAVANSSISVCDIGNDGTEDITFSDYDSFISLNDVANFNFAYYLSLTDAQDQVNEQTTQSLTGNTIYYVRISNSSNPSCYSITPINFNFTAAAISNLDVTLCDNNNDGIENNVDLEPYILNLLNGIDYDSFTIHSSQSDAENQINPITTSNITASSEFWIFLETNEDCTQAIGPITFNFNPAPAVRETDVITFNACDINYNHQEPFDWQTAIAAVMDISAGESITVHTSYNNATQNTGNQTNISDNTNPYYIRIENNSGCYTIIEQPVDVTFYGVDATSVTETFCFDGIQDYTVNLETYINDMLVDPTTGVDISLFANATDAEENNLTNILDETQTITTDGNLVEETYYVRFQLSEDCYTIRTITIRLVHPEPLADPIDVCDINNDDIEENALAIYDDLILGDQPGTVQYYLTEADAQNNSNEITTYIFDQPQTLYVNITVGACSEVYPITFQLQSVPPIENLNIDLGEVCDANADGITELDLTRFNSEVYTGSDDVTFNYYADYNPITEELTNPITTPTAYEVTNSFVFYIEVISPNMTCASVAEISVELTFTDIFEINPGDLYQCDFEFDFNEEFTLSEAIPQFVAGLLDYDEDLYAISYHLSQEDAENGINAIEGDYYTPNSATFIIYVRLENLVSNCVAINTLTLNTLGAPKPVNGFYAACDTNLNGIYDLDLNLLANEVMEETEGFNFSYYLTEEDALSNTNPLDATELYESDPFPSTIWVYVDREALPGCFDIKPVYIDYNTLTPLSIESYEVHSCDLEDDGLATFDLTGIEEVYNPAEYSIIYYETIEDVNIGANPISTPASYTNTIPYASHVIAVIQQGENCPNYVELDLQFSTIQVQVEDIIFCEEDEGALYPEILADNADYSFEWLDSSGNIVSTEQNLQNIQEADIYTLLVTNNANPSCQISLEVEAATYEPPVIVELIEEGNTITVVASGAYPIMYSINGIDWQLSDQFTNLSPGAHVFWVKYEEEGCISQPQVSAVLSIPNVITPNGDGYNDYILIQHLDVFDGEESEFYVYDRFGKEIFYESSNSSIRWDGHYQGRALNTTDYWYILRLPDGQEFTGSITVKNF